MCECISAKEGFSQIYGCYIENPKSVNTWITTLRKLEIMYACSLYVWGGGVSISNWEIWIVAMDWASGGLDTAPYPSGKELWVEERENIECF